ncbi:MAG: CopG family transcriptional regulator [Thermoproteota archaeon]
MTKRSKKKKFTTVSIPAPLFKKVKERIEGTGFTSVSSYVTYVLREVVAEEEEAPEPFSKEDEERVKERLRALGYID